jgi:ABC-type dipeptide/oligopeptide/nickel transport system permease component
MPVITFLGMMTAESLAGSIVVEQVFNLPGMGRLLVTAIFNRDYPVVQAVVLYVAAIVIVINFLVDLLYRKVDPRVN